eukprot:scaffold84720_cov20-Cyclotella_meneghiniana.AAC.1
MDDDEGAAALPVLRMMALGPDGVAAAGGWSISLLSSRYWPPWVYSSGGDELRGCGVVSGGGGRKISA